MLFSLVDGICSDIERLSLPFAAPDLENEILKAAPEAVDQLIQESSRFGSHPSRQAAAAFLAFSAFGYIKSIPTLARQLVEKVQDPSVPPARRCGLATALAYLVQPHDLIPDDSPGGYGFLDDAILLRGGFVAYLGSLPKPAANIESEAKIIVFLTKLTPSPVRATLQQAVSTMSQGVQVMNLLDPSMAEFMLAQVIANPLEVPSPITANSVVPAPTPDYVGARWQGGAFFEGIQPIDPGAPAYNQPEMTSPLS